MLDQLKELAKDNWKAALVGAILSAVVVLFGLPADTLFSIAGDAALDEDVRAEICEGYEPSEPTKTE